MHFWVWWICQVVTMMQNMFLFRVRDGFGTTWEVLRCKFICQGMASLSMCVVFACLGKNSAVQRTCVLFAAL